jgi:hypothetical protein
MEDGSSKAKAGYERYSQYAHNIYVFHKERDNLKEGKGCFMFSLTECERQEWSDD